MAASRTVADIVELPFQKIGSGTQWINVYEAGTHFDMEIARIFCIHTEQPAVRGRHAHKRCRQLLTPLLGRAELLCKDGVAERTFSLDSPSQGILVPAGIWVEVALRSDRNIVMVLCDRPYEEDDYLRDWSGFLAFRAKSGAAGAKSGS